MATFEDILAELPIIEDGQELRKLRTKHLNWTQTELAQALGVTNNTVSRWERGQLKIENPLMLGLALEALVERYDEEMIAKFEALRQESAETFKRIAEIRGESPLAR